MDNETERWVDGCLHYREGEPLLVVLPEGYSFASLPNGRLHIRRAAGEGALCGYAPAGSRLVCRLGDARDTGAVCQFCIRKLRALLRNLEPYRTDVPGAEVPPGPAPDAT